MLKQCENVSNIAIITVKGGGYHCVIHGISKSDAINLLENYVLDGCGYMWNIYIYIYIYIYKLKLKIKSLSIMAI